MHTKMTLACMTGFLLALGSTASLSQQPFQKPVKERTIHSSGGIGAPPTLRELYAMSPIVIDATVQGGRPMDYVLPSTSPGQDTVVIQTAHTAFVNEIFKDAVAGVVQGKRLEIVQLGGDRDRGDHIESVIDGRFPPLRKGERYVFFLKPSPSSDGTFVVSTGTPDGILSLEPDFTVKTRGSSKLARHLERYSRPDLINILRDLRDGR